MAKSIRRHKSIISCGEPYLVYDGAGVVKSSEFDFKGNVRHSERRLAKDYKQTPNWAPLATVTDPASVEIAAMPLLEAETFEMIITYDALDRMTSRATPDGSQIIPYYNEANMLEKVEAYISGEVTASTIIENIDYNARGQRIKVEHGNGATCEYSYDEQTFRLSRQTLMRPGPDPTLQDLEYNYDAAGNVVQVTDHKSFGNSDVSANGLYEYDGIYQLVSAEGREHPGPQPTHADPIRLPINQLNDLQALQNYREVYQYDEVGNILQMTHRSPTSAPGGWTRDYNYAARSNRLRGTTMPSDQEGQFSAQYTYDAAGNMVTMPHLSLLQWDYANRLQATARQVVNDGAPETTYYTYDATGERIRKVTEHDTPEGQVPTRKRERIYLGAFEVYREYGSDGTTPKLERETLHVTDDEHRVALIETKTKDTSIPAAAFQVKPITRYQVSNHFGSSLMELDEARAVISYEEYFPFGGTSLHAVDSSSEVSAKRFRYVGKEREEETGLYHHKARYRAAWLGRWVSADPAGLPGGINVYSAFRNNPITLTDPGGRQPQQNEGEASIFQFGLSPEDLCQGPCKTDDDVYGEIDRSLDYQRQQHEAWRQKKITSLGPSRKGAYNGRYLDAMLGFKSNIDLYRRPSLKEFFEYGVEEGHFHEWEAAEVARLYGITEATKRREFELKQLNKAYQRRNAFINEAKSIKFQVTGNIINGIIAAPVATAIDIGTAVKACSEGFGVECAAGITTSGVGVPGKTIKANAKSGRVRQAATKAELEAANPGASVQSEQLLRDATGQKVADPLTGTGRRLDEVVIINDKGVDTVETTSLNVNKNAQIAKERRIRESGGVYVRDRRNRELVEVPESRVVKRK